MTTGRPGRVRRVFDFLRWRGAAPSLFLVLREVLRPICYWFVYYIYEIDVTQVGDREPGETPGPILVYHGPSQRPGATRAVLRLGHLTPDEIERRLSRGDAVAVAFAGTEPIACVWITRDLELHLAFDTSWQIGADEAVFHDSFVLPRWRGRRIHRALVAVCSRFALENGVTRALASVSVLNRPSLRIATVPGHAHVMTLALFRLKGLGRTWHLAASGNFRSRFSASEDVSRDPRPSS